MIPTNPSIDTPGFIILKEGGEIRFGQALEGEKLNNGPIPILCNLWLAVARVLKMSGTADITLEWKDHADISPLPPKSDMLDAKLFLSGRAVLA